VKPNLQRLQPWLDLPPPRTPKELKRVSGMFCIKPNGSIPKFSKTASDQRIFKNTPSEFQNRPATVSRLCVEICAWEIVMIAVRTCTVGLQFGF